MQLAADPIVIEIAGEAYELRPTLRAAMRLTRKHGDFLAIYNAILADHVSAVSDIVREGSGSPQAATHFLTACQVEGVRKMLEPLEQALKAFVLQLAGIDDDADDQANEPAGEPMPLNEFYTTLFRIGTGWLGWSREDTWEATPAEILAAQRGRTDLIGDVLKGILGAAEDDDQRPLTHTLPKLNADGTDSAFDRAGLAKLKGLL